MIILNNSLTLKISKERFELMQEAFGNEFGFQFMEGVKKGTELKITLLAKFEF